VASEPGSLMTSNSQLALIGSKQWGGIPQYLPFDPPEAAARALNRF